MSEHVELTMQHSQMLDLLQAERLAILDGDVARARALLARLDELQHAHLVDEESRLIPSLPESARWHARIYVAEHRKLCTMMIELRAGLDALPAYLADGGARLAVLDSQIPFKHVLEHHLEREEKGLFVEVGTGNIGAGRL